MLKRLFWLALIAGAGLIAWLWRQRQEDFAGTAPQFAPPKPFPPLSSAEPADTPPATAPSQPATPPIESSADIQAAGEAERPAQAEVAPESPGQAAPASEATAALADEPAPAAPVAQPESEDGDLGEVVGYCVRCKTKRPISDAHEETTESGRRAARGVCPVCGANMFTFLKEEPD